jgi:ABC-type multidrug transport system ATPase subunit
MNGFLRIWSLEGEWRLDLPQASCWLAATEGVPQLLTGKDAGARAGILWDARSCRWLLQLPPAAGGDPEDGQPLVPARAIYPAGDWLLELHRVPEPPREGGRECPRLRLDRKPLVIGRGAETPAAGTRRLELDPQDSSVSKDHVRLEADGATWRITDLSKTGAELNGQAFASERLVFGDRFRIGPYTFDFTGDGIAWTREELNTPVVARGVCVDVRDRRILHGASLAVRRGDFVGVLGGSGSGKSTLLSVLCGIRRPSAGQVLVNGVPQDQADATDIGFVPQDDIVHAELTVEDALHYAARLRLRLDPRQIGDLVDHTLRRIGLDEHRHKQIRVLSGGQRKRVSIATELLTKPSLLYLDEPSSGLDPNTEEGLMSMLQSLTVTGLTVVCTTHVLQKAYLFDRLCFIDRGRVIFWGTVEEAGEHFFSLSQAGGDESFQRTPLERVYGLLGESGKPAEAWEEEFRHSPAGQRQAIESALPPAPPDRAARPPRRPRPGFFTKLAVLLARQAAILRADPLNLAFLLAQAVIIGALAGWVSQDVSLRTFLCVVATLWFGCSNGAQQIVSEIAVFRRESVCGLGTGLYVLGKSLFLCVLTMFQALLLFGVAAGIGNAVHNRDFDAEMFHERLEARYAADAPPAPPGTASAPSFEGFDLVEEGVAPPAAPAAGGSAAAAAPAPQAPPAPGRLAAGVLGFLARWLNLEQNILESGPRTLLDAAGNPLADAAGNPLRAAGEPVWRVVAIALLLKLAALLLTATVGVAGGLAISALVRSNTQAVMWVPLILIPQILFGGYVVRPADMTPSALAFSRLMPSFLCQRVMDVANLFGQATPYLSNRTKTALFLTTDGAKETVRWEEGGREWSQSYDKLSDFNTSWQNLLVDPQRNGQHKSERTPGTSEIRDTTTARRDVLYKKATVFRHPAPAGGAALGLAAWVALSALLTFLGLARQRRMV